MSQTILNVVEANTQLALAQRDLQTEQDARKAVTSDLEAAKVEHAEELQKLKDQHSQELSDAAGNHAKEVTKLSDELEKLKTDLADSVSEVERLKDESKSADDKAAEIVGQAGGEAVEVADDSAGGTPKTKTPEEIQAAYAEQRKIEGSAAKHAYWVKNIAPFEK